MDIYFIFWIIIQYYHHLFYCSDCCSFSHGSSFRLASVSFQHIPILFLALPFPLMPKSVLGVSFILNCLSPGSTISVRNSNSFYCRMIFRNQNLDNMYVYVAAGVSSFLDAPSRQNLEIYACIIITLSLRS